MFGVNIDAGMNDGRKEEEEMNDGGAHRVGEGEGKPLNALSSPYESPNWYNYPQSHLPHLVTCLVLSPSLVPLSFTPLNPSPTAAVTTLKILEMSKEF